MAHSQSELQFITFAKYLCSYVMTVTQKSPKQFSFSPVGRMQGYVPDVVNVPYRTGGVFAPPDGREGRARRQAHQRQAKAEPKPLSRTAIL